MPISSFNKKTEHIRVKITKQEVRSYNAGAGINVTTYPRVNFERNILHDNGLRTKIETQNSADGEVNMMLGVSGVHFEPLERRYPEDIQKAMEKLNIMEEHVPPSQEPNHLDGPKCKPYNLQYMEHTTFVDNPTLDAIDKVRSIMTDKRPIVINQYQLKMLERKMMRNPLIYGVPSNAQAVPRFIKEINHGARNPHTGLKEFEAEIGTY